MIDRRRDDRAWTVSRRDMLASSAAVALFCRGGLTAAAAQDAQPSFRQGDGQFTFLEPIAPVPDIRLTRLRGGALNMRQTAGKVVLLNFWASWCGPCIREIPSLERLARSRDRSKLEVLAVAMDRRREPVERFLRSRGIVALDVFIDPNEQVAAFDQTNPNGAPFVLYGLPISYLINRQGGVVGYFAGEADWTSEPAQRLLDYYL
ncbi:MAG: TlpA family protein disulfide reductase [Methylocystis sp.]|nr:TlpA family protein disulfide reductase [Methylocystis sp.]